MIIEAQPAEVSDLDAVFRELTVFAPDPTETIEQEKANERRSDSLVCHLGEYARTVDEDKILRAGYWLLDLALRHQEWTAELTLKPRRIKGVSGTVLYHERCDFGDIVIGGDGPNEYAVPFAVIIDLGGDDTYAASAQPQGFTIIVDRSGNDCYVSEDHGIACGYFGVGIIVDGQGDDCYQGRSYTIGCGVFGVGILVDSAGNDHYYGDTFTEGAAGFGIGILSDGAGNDQYQGALYAQGFASTRGIGICDDRRGNDQYVIAEKYLDEIRYLDHYLSLSQGFTIGFRPDLSAGIGMILDGSGNDYYLSDIFGQACGYWYGLGAIVDSRGNDTYVSYQYAQGAATHLALGVLVDGAGDDTYAAKGVSQGCGHDLALGVLWDRDGHDTYTAYDLSQGVGNANGIGLLVDDRGDDTYAVKRHHNTQGYGDFRREYGSIGMLIDAAGNDYYPAGTDESLWSRGRHGLRIDWE